MYKILLRHQNERNKHNTIWHSYGEEITTTSMSKSSTNTFKEFETDDLKVLEDTIEKLNKQYGNDDIRVINDVTYEVMIKIAESVDLGNAEVATSEDVEDVFNTAFNKVFGGE